MFLGIFQNFQTIFPLILLHTYPHYTVTHVAIQSIKSITFFSKFFFLSRFTENTKRFFFDGSIKWVDRRYTHTLSGVFSLGLKTAYLYFSWAYRTLNRQPTHKRALLLIVSFSLSILLGTFDLVAFTGHRWRSSGR